MKNLGFKTRQETTAQIDARQQKKYRQQLKDLFNAGGTVTMGQNFPSDSGFSSRDIYIGGWYVGVIMHFPEAYNGVSYQVTAGSIGMYSVNCKSFIDGLNKITKKVGL